MCMYYRMPKLVQVAHTHVHAYIHTHTNMSNARELIHAWAHIYMKFVNGYIQIHTHRCAYTYTYVHTYTYIWVWVRTM